jgi:hypothetical protein
MNESTPKSRFQHTQVSLRLPAHILRRVDEFESAAGAELAAVDSLL